VDDEEHLRYLGKTVLESQGYEVLCAADGFEALAALKKSLPDMIISDLRMRNMNGFEFLSAGNASRLFPSLSSRESSPAFQFRRVCWQMRSFAACHQSPWQ
jgi:CheY-like chemotaxis protein